LDYAHSFRKSKQSVFSVFNFQMGKKKTQQAAEAEDITAFIHSPRKPAQLKALSTDEQIGTQGAVDFPVAEGTNASFFAYGLMGTIGYVNVLYTFIAAYVLFASPGTIRQLLIVVSIGNALNFVFFGMHLKLSMLNPYHHIPYQPDVSGIDNKELKHELLLRAEVKAERDFIRHTRNERRSISMILACAATAAANITAAYLACVATDVDNDARSFRDTGVNTYASRTMDVMEVAVIMTVIPQIFSAATEVVFLIQAVKLPRFAPLDEENENSRLTPGAASSSDSPKIVTQH
jgi:hypothetical protein